MEPVLQKFNPKLEYRYKNIKSVCPSLLNYCKLAH